MYTRFPHPIRVNPLVGSGPPPIDRESLWDFLQKTSLVFTLGLTIKSLMQSAVGGILRDAPIFVFDQQRRISALPKSVAA